MLIEPNPALSRSLVKIVHIAANKYQTNICAVVERTDVEIKVISAVARPGPKLSDEPKKNLAVIHMYFMCEPPT